MDEGGGLDEGAGNGDIGANLKGTEEEKSTRLGDGLIVRDYEISRMTKTTWL